ncbi:MAG: Spy/CpxP family protein refolding chaperone [bacterium]
MKKYMLLVLIIVVSLLTFGDTSFAQFGLPKGKWWKHPEVIQNINLSAVQIREIEKISNESMKKIIELEAQYKIGRLDLDTLLDQIDREKLDLDAIEKQVDIVNKLKGELDKERILMLARIRNILPKEAIQKLKKLRGEFRGGRKNKGNGQRNKRKNSMNDDFQSYNDRQF